MKIEIDTKKDSADDIKKTIDFLLKFVSEANNIEDLPSVNEGTFNLFDKPSEDKDEDKDNVSIIEY
ncbi:hypothetical protein CMO90_02675 [Candidatus Woesearchaeota archaeon]|jgi:hypothetical protein|nr:hypothetical protein [Candidatus Woesearchaeota archaeon]|tara:strand:+ start:114 stop:311 length:198 start_codon:yes stop_codon:yes gene_type:complete